MIFTRSYPSELLIVTPTMTPSLVKPAFSDQSVVSFRSLVWTSPVLHPLSCSWRHLIITVSTEELLMDSFWLQYSLESGWCCSVTRSIFQTWTAMVRLEIIVITKIIIIPYLIRFCFLAGQVTFYSHLTELRYVLVWLNQNKNKLRLAQASKIWELLVWRASWNYFAALYSCFPLALITLIPCFSLFCSNE